MTCTDCYRLDVTVEDDEGTIQEMSQYEIVSHDNPPFDIDTENDEHLDQYKNKIKTSYSSDNPGGSDPKSKLSQKRDGVKISGILGNIRHKRSLDKMQHECIKSEDDSSASNKAVTVEVGERIHLPCHSCSEDEQERFEPMQWLKLYQFPNSKGLFHIREVTPDLHDDEKLNRIVLSLDHTLVKL